MKQKNIDEHYHTLKNDVKKYVELKLDYLKLEFVEFFSIVYSKIITTWVLVIVFFAIFVFLLVALALYLGKLWNAYHLGFLIVAGIFFVFMLIFLIFKNRILTNPMIDLLISVFFEKKIEEEQKKESK